MKSFVPSLYKFILGMFFFGLALWANPIEGYCSGSNSVDLNISGNLPFQYNIGNQAFNLNDDLPMYNYGLVPYSSFTINLATEYKLNNTAFDANVSGVFKYDIYVNYNASNGGAYNKFLGTIIDGIGFSDLVFNAYNYQFEFSVDGIPTGLRIVANYGDNILYARPSFINGIVNNSDGTSSSVSLSDTTSSYNGYFGIRMTASFSNFNFVENGSSGGGNTIINNTTGNLVPIGYSSLNFGLNGSTYFLGASRIFEPSYLSPLMFNYDFANSPLGVVSSAPLTLAMGGYDSPPNTAHASPIAVIGDTRAGEYELTIALCLSNSPSQAQLSALTTLSNWGFEFNRGYSGQQFSLPSNTRISYTNFTDSKTGYVYTSVYFYFTTPDYFDSFLIRKAPSLNNIRVGAFAFNKYTGTISDQLTQSNQQWDYQNPSHSSFSSANSSAASTVSAFSSIESDSFNNLDTAMSGAGVNDFNINVISTPLATVSGMINQTYNILPDLIKWLILAILVIGIFAVIISANNYVNKD